MLSMIIKFYVVLSKSKMHSKVFVVFYLKFLGIGCFLYTTFMKICGEADHYFVQDSFILKTSLSRSMLDCASQCSENVECLSINYCKSVETNICDMMNVTLADAGKRCGDIISQNKCSYIEKVSCGGCEWCSTLIVTVWFWVTFWWGNGEQHWCSGLTFGSRSKKSGGSSPGRDTTLQKSQYDWNIKGSLFTYRTCFSKVFFFIYYITQIEMLTKKICNFITRYYVTRIVISK